MEFKYTKGSKTLEDLSKQYIEQENTCRLKAKEEKYARMEKEGYLHSAQELIDYVLGGNRIVAADDPNEFLQLCDGKVFRKYLAYNDVDMPIGYYGKYETIEEFIEWANRCEQYQKEYGAKFVNEYFHKDLNEEKYV